MSESTLPPGALATEIEAFPPGAGPNGVRYVPLAIIRERLQIAGAGVFEAFAEALDALPADKRWHLLTLREGVASDDPDAIALLQAVGADPAVVLAS